jgi:hypothetical protein
MSWRRYGTCVKRINMHKNFRQGILKGKHHLEELSIDGRLMTTWIFKK